MIGNVYPRRGPGPSDCWVVVSIKPNGICIVLGLDSDGNIVAAQHYQSYYLKQKTPIATINVEDIRFHDTERSKQSSGPETGVGPFENKQDLRDPASWPVRVVTQTDGDLSRT